MACLAQPVLGVQDNAPTVTSVESKIEELIAIQEPVESPQRTSAIETLKKAVVLLKKANDLNAKATEFSELTREAPQLLNSIREELSQPPVDPTIDIPEGATLSQLEQTLDTATASLQAARQRLTELQAETVRRDEVRPVLTERLVQLKQELADVQSAGGPMANPEVPNQLVEARSVYLEASIIAQESEINAIERELESYEARRELLPARRDRAQRRVTAAQSLVDKWQVIIANKRKLEAEQAIADAKKLRREAARQHPVLKAYAEESLGIANSLVNPRLNGGDVESYAQRLVRARTELRLLNSDFSSIQTRLNASGLNRATGLLLRNQYEKIPDIAELRSEIRTIHDTLEDFDYALIVIQERRIEAGDIDRVAQSLLAQMPITESSTEQSEFLQVARELATARRGLLDKLIGEASNNLQTLIELDTSLRETELVARSYSDYIEERILWVRSIAKGRTFSTLDMQDAIDWIINPASWSQAWFHSKQYISTRRINMLIGGALFLMLLVTSFRCRRWLANLSDRVSRYITDSFRYTVFAFLLTTVMAAPVATVLLIAGWILRAPENQVEIARSVGTGLYAAALYLYPLAFFRHLLRPRGLAIAHFKWPKDSAYAIRKNLRWFTPTIVPLVALVAAIDHGGDESANASLGRVLFTISLVLLAVFLHRVLSPKGKVLQWFVERNADKWVHRTRYVWYPLAVLLPLGFAVVSWLGFHYTALQLQSRLEWTLILILILVTGNEILHRWLYVARRRVAVEDAKRRRQQAESEAENQQGSNEALATTAATIDEDRVDLPALSEQTKQLFKTAVVITAFIGLYFIWAQALPALKMFDRMQVWPTVQVLDTASGDSSASMQSEPVSTASSTTSEASGSNTTLPQFAMMQTESSTSEDPSKAVVSVTVADVGIAIIILMATWIAFRNVPGLIEIVVLQRLPLDAGSRYALSTVIRYLIVVVGMLIAFQAVGISWSNVQWLAAALTFGLAFGLQEIFANFVSGLIILAERPIRLGDTVTVGETSGTVMKIRMRATTISDWNRKELIIPNKTFITSDVINWSLTDPILRVSIMVGVSYSSDVDKVERLLYKIANDNNTVLEDPKPTVIFKEFGDSTLNFEVRVFIPHIDFFVPVRHEIHNAIFKVFKDEGVEIAFPQRDLNIRSIGDLGKLVEQHKPQGS